MRKLFSAAVALGVLASTSIMSIAYADVSANALPSLNNKVNADVTTSGSNMNIQIQGGQGSLGTLNWNNYNIGKDASVNYEFSAHNQTALNKVDAAGGISQIYGKITTSGCAGCGYDATGKVILINPNGVLFGDGANVNLNSFTVSTMDGEYDTATNQLKLNKGSNQSDFGIVVENGATVHGDKNVTFASNNITLYNGSKISTNVAPNVGDTSYGKVKLVTADGVNFTYYNNGAVKEISGIKGSTDKMYISMNGDIQSGNIDVRNYSTDEASEINLKGATLKATKAVEGNDGNIWLTASNKIVAEDSTFETANYTDEAAAVEGGNVRFLAGKKVSVGTSKINSVGNVDVTSQNYDVVLDKTEVAAAKDVNVKAANIASIQNGSKVKAKNIKVKSDKDAWTSNSSLDADLITIEAGNDVVAYNVDLNNKKTVINAGNDVDINVKNVAERQNGLVAKAGNNMKVTTDGALSVSSLISGNDMTIDAKEVISGYDKTSNILREEGDSADRAYIEVGGKFTSNPSYEVTDSADLTADGKYNQRHHIQYGDGSEKILLVNKLPYTPKPDEPTVEVDDDQATMLNKLPRQPEVFNNATVINDGRTTFVDVFAAASQIEIVEDEE